MPAPTNTDVPPARLAFCANLRAARLNAGLNQGQMAEALGVSQPTYNQVENGLYDPKLSTIVRAASVLGVTPGELLDLANLATA